MPIIFLLLLSAGNSLSLQAQDLDLFRKEVDSMLQLPLSDNDSLMRERWYQMGDDLFILGEYDSSTTYTMLAHELSKSMEEDLLRADILMLLGKNQLNVIGPRDKSTSYFLNALDIYTRLKNDAGMATANMQLGVLSFTMSNYEEAVSYLTNTTRYAHDNKRILAVTHYLLALSYSELGQFDEAAAMFEQAKMEYGSDNLIASMQIDAFKGKLYVNQKDYDRAIEQLNYTIEQYSGQVDDEMLAPTYAFLARAWLLNGDDRQAIRYGLRAYHLANTGGSYIIYFQEAEETLHQAYKNIGKTDSAYYYLHELSGLKDSVNSVAAMQRVAELKGKFEYEQELASRQAEQALKDAITAKELEKEKLLRNIFIGGFVLLIGFSGLVILQRNHVSRERKRSDTLLLNILPAETADELKTKGSAEAKQFDKVTVLFTDFVGFTSISQHLSPKELVAEINTYFTVFDDIIERNGLEKIKTIGDAYMAVCGMPHETSDHALRAVRAALEIRDHVRNSSGRFSIRIGLHSGQVVAGIVGVKKFQYDIWGDTVNTASRMESNSEPGKVNISEDTQYLLQDETSLQFEYRGRFEVKGKGETGMFFVDWKGV